MATDPDIFAAAEQDDPAALLERIPDSKSPFELCDRDGISLVLFCLYRGLRKNLAACAGRVEKADALRLLIAATSDIDARQGGGWTPLMPASVNGMAEAAAALLEAGADAALASDKGKAAADLAREQGHLLIVERRAKAG